MPLNSPMPFFMAQVIPCDATGILVSFAAEEYNKSQHKPKLVKVLISTTEVVRYTTSVIRLNVL